MSISLHSCPSSEKEKFLKYKSGGIWVVQSVKRLILDFSSTHDLSVCKFKPRIGLCVDSAEGFSLFPSLSNSHLFSLSLSKVNIKKNLIITTSPPSHTFLA